MRKVYTASELLEAIERDKKEAIISGIIREEKPLPIIDEREKPHELPQGWQWVRLGDYALKVTDYVASGSFASLKENVLITNEPNYAIMVKTADFSNGFSKNLTYTDQHGYEFLKNSNLFGGELILSNIGSIGKVFIVPYLEKPMTLASNTVMVKVTDDELIKYLYYYFVSPLGQRTLKGISSGTSMMKFNKTQLKNTLVPIAPLEEQRYIVSLLGKTEAIIDGRKKELNKLDDLIKARFVELFGDPLINSQGLDTMPMTEVCEIIDGDRGKNYPTADEFSNEGYCLFLNAKNVTASGFNFDNCMFVSKEKDEALRKGKLSRGDVVLTTRGTLGNLAFYTDEIPFEHVRINSGMVILRMKQEVLDEVYFIEQFKMQLADIKEKIASGSAQPQLPISTMNKIQILIPKIERQKQFADFVRQVDKSKFRVKESLRIENISVNDYQYRQNVKYNRKGFVSLHNGGTQNGKF